MAPLDVAGLPPISAEAPTGENLELDPDFGALERAVQGKPETQYGNTVEPAVPPDWKEAVDLAESLLRRTHDLRVLVLLAIAQLHVGGLVEFAAVVRLIRQELDTRWEDVHPRLDPEDDLDPMQRSNALLQLQDPARVLRPLRDATLASTPRTGPVSWRSLAILNGTLEPESGRDKLSEAAAYAAFSGSDPARLQAVRDAVAGLLEDVPAIAAAFDRNCRVGAGPSYDDLLKLLRDMQKELKRFEVASAAAPEPEAAAPGLADDAAEAVPAPRTGRSFATIQAITSLTKRDEALHALDLAAAYFRGNEPSSPLPILIDRAKRLATMEFMDILRDLAPDGVSQAQVIAGPNGSG